MSALGHSAATSADQATVSVPGSRLQEFEPRALGAFGPRFRRLCNAIAGKKQSEIRARLEQEARVLDAEPKSTDLLAYRTTVLLLRDYVSSGYYPLIADGSCYLAPLFESPAFSAAARRHALQALYTRGRNRALRERDQYRWLETVAGAIRESPYDPSPVIEAIIASPPQIELRQATTNDRPLDARGLWRAVRSTWSMGPEASAPGREVAFLVVDRRWPDTPLGITQFRNVVPEIMDRDLWLGVATGEQEPAAQAEATGYVRLLVDRGGDPRDRIRATGDCFGRLLAHVRREGLPDRVETASDLEPLADLLRSKQRQYQELRRAGDTETPSHVLAVIKRAETAIDLVRGVTAADALATSPDPIGDLSRDGALKRDFDAGLKKLWHYHMGFVALEMSICGAAPPFGPLRLGKLMAALAASTDVVAAWGSDRPLGTIATQVYEDDVRHAIPNPGPLVVLTSGLYPGHSAQYTRVAAGPYRWRKIGETTGYGSFHIGVDTAQAVMDFNAAADGYVHITRTFGEGSGARFRAVGRALSRLGLPDLRRHETRRPLYALPLVDDPQGVLLGWKSSRGSMAVAADEVADEWWRRWVFPRRDELGLSARQTLPLPDILDRLISQVGRT